MIVGIVSPDEGKIFFDQQDITHFPIHKRACLGLGYLSQEPSVFRNLTVEENIMAILETLPLSKKEREARLNTLLKELRIEHLRKNKAYTLSGGEMRRLEITRSLVTNPSFLLLPLVHILLSFSQHQQSTAHNLCLYKIQELLIYNSLVP